MAGEGILTALQAALSGLSGGISGAQQFREAKKREQLAQEDLDLRKRGLAAQMGLTPIEDVLPEEQGKVGPLAPTPAAPRVTAPPAPAPSTLGQFLAGQTQAPTGMAAPQAPAMFGPSAAAPAAPKSAVEAAIEKYVNAPKQTTRMGGQRYALPRGPEETTAFNAALQRAIAADAETAAESKLSAQAKRLAPFVGGNEDKARMVLGGIAPELMGIDMMSPLQKKKYEADIEQSKAAAAASYASAAAQRSAADLNAELAKTGGRRNPEQVLDNIINAAARFAITPNPETGELPSKDNVAQYFKSFRDLAGVQLPPEQEFTSAKEQAFIAEARKLGATPEMIRAELRKRQAPSDTTKR